MANKTTVAPPTERDALLPAATRSSSSQQSQQPPQSPLTREYEREVHRRQRLLLVLTLISLSFAGVGALLVWQFAVLTQQRQAARPAIQAASALDRLNHPVKKTDNSNKYAKGCQSTLLIFRHCEKYGAFTVDQDGNSHCSFLGYQRAEYIATLFGDDASSRWPVPAHLFALSPGRSDHLNFREWESLRPLSKKVGIVTEIADQETFPNVYFELLQSGSLCGQVTVISWEHDLIQELVLDLACGPDNGCPTVYPDDSFDDVWQLKYVRHADEQERPDDENDEEEEIKNSPSLTIVQGESDDDTVAEETKEQQDYDDDYSYTVDQDDDTNNDTNSTTRRLIFGTHAHRQRRRKRKRKSPHTYSKDGWNVYATVTHQNFDPLAFDKLHGGVYYNYDSYEHSSSSGSRSGGGGRRHKAMRLGHRDGEML